jgi:hypothetical protein
VSSFDLHNLIVKQGERTLCVAHALACARLVQAKACTTLIESLFIRIHIQHQRELRIEGRDDEAGATIISTTDLPPRLISCSMTVLSVRIPRVKIV